MNDYLKTGRWISPRDALPAERQIVLAWTQGEPVVAYLEDSVWYAHDWPSYQSPTIGSTQAVDRWMHIPTAGQQPEVQVLVEATAASIDEVNLHRDHIQRIGDDPPVVFCGATIRFDGAFDRVGPISNRPIARLRLVAEYLP